MIFKQISIENFNFVAVWRVGSPEAGRYTELESHLFPPLPSPSWVSPLHRAESEAPHQAASSAQLDWGPALRKLWQVMGRQGGSR